MADSVVEDLILDLEEEDTQSGVPCGDDEPTAELEAGYKSNEAEEEGEVETATAEAEELDVEALEEDAVDVEGVVEGDVLEADSAGEFERDLSEHLEVPLDIVSRMTGDADFKAVVQKMVVLLNGKNEEVEQFQSTLQQFSSELESKDGQLEDLAAQLEGEVRSRKDIEEIASASQTTMEWLSERVKELETKATEDGELRQRMEQSLQDTKGELQQTLAELEATQTAVKNTEEQLSDATADLERSQARVAELSVPPPDVPGADRPELLRLLDRRQLEIGRLGEEWRGMAERMEELSAAKTKCQTQLDEVSTQESSLRLREQLLAQERRLVGEQNGWLSEELQSKARELLAVRRERATTVATLETRLTTSQQEVQQLSAQVSALQSSREELEARSEGHMTRVRETREEQAAIEEQLRKELAQQAKLCELYQGASVEGERRVEELVRGVEQLQAALETVTQERDDFLSRLHQEQDSNVSELARRNEETSSLQLELERANQLIASLQTEPRVQTSGATDILSISPSAAKASAMLKSGVTLTQIYSQYVEASDALRALRAENASLSSYIERVREELEHKTPLLQRLRLDHDTTRRDNQGLRDKMATSLEECQALRLESEEAVRGWRSVQRENERMKSLTADLGRQVQVLLKECEEARGGVASSYSSHDMSHDVSSSSQVISEQLVVFRSIEELQSQNQKLLAVVRELSEQRETGEREAGEEHTKELRGQLQAALEEVEGLRESRERQKTLVESIVTQRDMYRTLLAQATPLPRGDDTSRLHGDDGDDDIIDSDSVATGGGSSVVAKQLQEAEERLAEVTSQFEAYRKEKRENDGILQEQLGAMREQCSEFRLDNAKLSSKLESSTDRYQLLDSHHSALKAELELLRSKTRQLSDSLSALQAGLHSSTRELLTAREELSSAKIAAQTARSEKQLLSESERRARQQYEDLLRQQKSQNILLTNLESIQNNLERSEFETKTRLGAQIDSLQKELALFKERLTAEEDRRVKVSEAYDLQVRELQQNLDHVKQTLFEAQSSLQTSEEQVKTLTNELAAARTELVATTTELDASRDRVLQLEEDAGAVFRRKIRLLERNLADSKTRCSALEEQLEAAKSHEAEYREMSLASERALQELNATSEQFRSDTEGRLAEGAAREEGLVAKQRALEEEQSRLEAELAECREESEAQISLLKGQLAAASSRADALQLEVTTVTTDLAAAKSDACTFSREATETQRLYQHELMQHGRSMEELLVAKEKVKQSQEQLSSLQASCARLEEELAGSEERWGAREAALRAETVRLEARADDLTQQNTRLHKEAENLCAKLLTLQDSTADSLPTPPHPSPATVDSTTQSSSEQLWEVIRFVRREKDIAETKRELAETENQRHRRLSEQLQRQLDETREQLKQVEAAAKTHSMTSTQHAEILAKVERLNLLSDSNKLLREERDQQVVQLRQAQERSSRLEEEMMTLKETNKQLLGQKGALLAEKTALRNEVQRWNTRTNQLIEQYNKVDPEEYKKLLSERDATEARLEELQTCLDGSRAETQRLQTELSAFAERLAQQESDVTAKQDDITAKGKLIGKLREVGRKYRTLSDEKQKEVEGLRSEVAALRRKLEEPPAPSEAPPPNTELLEKTQALEEAEKSLEEQRSSLQQLEGKHNKALKTIKAARTRLQTLTAEKDQVGKELEEVRAEKDRLCSEAEALQLRLGLLQSKYDTDTKKQEATIQKLWRGGGGGGGGGGRKTQTASGEGGPQSIQPPPSSAPIAAVKPTVTTTPVGSIRPMAVQTVTVPSGSHVTAPTAHVTPTMVSSLYVTPAPVPAPPQASQTSASSTSTAAATVFVRSPSPQVSTAASTTTIVPPSSSLLPVTSASHSNSLASSTAVSAPTVGVVSVATAGVSVATTAVSTAVMSITTATTRTSDSVVTVAVPSTSVVAMASPVPTTVASGAVASSSTGVSMATSSRPGEEPPRASKRPRESDLTAEEEEEEEEPGSSSVTEAPPSSKRVRRRLVVRSEPAPSSQPEPSQTTTTTSSSSPDQPRQQEEGLDTLMMTSEPQELPDEMHADEAPPNLQEDAPLSDEVTMETQSTQVQTSDTSQVQTSSEVAMVTARRESRESSEMYVSASDVATEATSQSVIRTRSRDSMEEVTEGISGNRADSSETVETVVMEMASAPDRQEAEDVSMLREEPASPALQDVSSPDDVITQEALVSEDFPQGLGDGEEPPALQAELVERVSASHLEPADTTQSESRALSEEREASGSPAGEESEGSEAGEEVEAEDDLEEEEEEIESSGESEYESDSEEEGGVVSAAVQPMRSQYETQHSGSFQEPIVIDSDSGEGSEGSEGGEGSEEEEEEEEEVQIHVPQSDDEVHEIRSGSESEEDENERSPDHEEGSHDQYYESHDQETAEPIILEIQDEQDGGDSHGDGEMSHDQLPQSTASLESEHSMGLPEVEMSMDLNSIPNQPVSHPPALRPTSFGSRSRRLQQFSFAGDRSAMTPGFEGDSVVPHTPVLNDGKQLHDSKQPQTLPSTPVDPRPLPPTQVLESSLLHSHSTTGVAHLQLLGEASIDVGLVPPASLRPERSHDPQDLAEMIGGDGDINDDVIYDIVAQTISSDEEEGEGGEASEGGEEVGLEEGELEEEEEEEEEEEGDPEEEPAGLDPTPSSSSQQHQQPSSSAGGVDVGQEGGSSESEGKAVDASDQTVKPKPMPIVWDEPSSSSGAAGSGGGGRGGARRINIRRSAPRGRGQAVSGRGQPTTSQGRRSIRFKARK